MEKLAPVKLKKFFFFPLSFFVGSNAFKRFNPDITGKNNLAQLIAQ
jgi:hypothetical protein